MELAEVFFSSSQGGEDTICYGALVDAKARLSSSSKNDKRSHWSRYYTYPIIHRGRGYYLRKTADIAEPDFAMLSDDQSRACLHSLKPFSALGFIAVIPSDEMDRLSSEKGPKRSTAEVILSVNIVGPTRLADEVGSKLATVQGGSLQHPLWLPAGIPYINPHYFYPGNEKSDLRDLVGPPKSRLFEGITNVFGSLDGNNDAGHSSSVDEATISHVLRSHMTGTLKRHQFTGVRFMLNRENPRFVADSQYKYYFSRIGSPPVSLGGILADVMGMGKTLTTLCAVVCSKVQRNKDRDQTIGRRSSNSSTLVVLPSRQVLDAWDSEIEQWFHPGTVRRVVFHGDNRTKEYRNLANFDVVLTTYETLVADQSPRGHRVLMQIGWLRIILDEAHFIRDPSTKKFQAVTSLRADLRWCLTGTPIQNRMEDLRSLLRFLRLEPFAERNFFEQHVIGPLKAGQSSEDSFVNLKRLLELVCLRRVHNTLELQLPTIEEIHVTLTSEEQISYDRTLQECKTEFDQIVSGRSDRKKCNVLFSTIVTLRRLCNHGTCEPAAPLSRGISPSPRKRRKTSMINTLESTAALACEFCSNEETRMSLEDSESCPSCGRQLQGFTESTSTVEFLDPGQSSFLRPLSPLSVSSHSSRSSPIPSNGHSSKLVAVVDKIYQLIEQQQDSKHIAFTSWCQTLDMLERMLGERGITSIRIDGRVKMDQRSGLLAGFRNGKIPVLLMSIGTGAVGLTLTCANHVHIIEPQWNPFVEAQAIGRAHRIGQTRPVTVYKYIVRKTVEQNIVKLQSKKSRIAQISLDNTTTDIDESVAIDDYKFVLDPDA